MPFDDSRFEKSWFFCTSVSYSPVAMTQLVRDSFAAHSGGGTRAAAARARSEEIAEELRSMETTP